MRIQFIRLDETGHRSTKRKLYRAERQSVGIAHLELAHTARLIVKRAGMVWEKPIIGDVLEPAKYRVALGQVPIRLSPPGGLRRAWDPVLGGVVGPCRTTPG